IRSDSTLTDATERQMGVANMDGRVVHATAAEAEAINGTLLLLFILREEVSRKRFFPFSDCLEDILTPLIGHYRTYRAKDSLLHHRIVPAHISQYRWRDV